MAEVVGHEVDEVDASQVVGEHEEVAGLLLSLVWCLIVSDESHVRDGDVKLTRFRLHGCVVGEGMGVVSDDAFLDGFIDDGLDHGDIDGLGGYGSLLASEPTGVVSDGLWCYLREEDVTACEGEEFLQLVFSHGGGGVTAIFAELIDGHSGVGGEGHIILNGLHVFQDVAELFAGILVRRDDALQTVVVVVEKFAEFEIDGCSVWLSDDLPVGEMGEAGDLVFGHDIMSLRFVADGDANLIGSIFGSGMFQDGEFDCCHL